MVWCLPASFDAFADHNQQPACWLARVQRKSLPLIRLLKRTCCNPAAGASSSAQPRPDFRFSLQHRVVSLDNGVRSESSSRRSHTAMLDPRLIVMKIVGLKAPTTV